MLKWQYFRYIELSKKQNYFNLVFINVVTRKFIIAYVSHCISLVPCAPLVLDGY